MDDGPILQQFLDSAAQEPFAQLVARHVHLVYSSCLRQLKDPNLADQATLFRLLEPETFGLTLTEGFMMDPEASVSGLVFHHPAAKYFKAD